MKLIEFSHKAGDWKINNLVLGDVNLIVGENAVGKSRTIDAIGQFAGFISKRGFLYSRINRKNYWWSAKFLTSEGSILEYEISIVDKKITKEVLIVDGLKLVDRVGERATIFSLKKDISIEIYPPLEELVVNVRRDINEYMEFEKINDWSLLSVIFYFLTYDNKVYDSFFVDQFESLNEDQRFKVITICNNIGFKISEIFSQKIGSQNSNLKFLVFKEQGIQNDIFYSDLSRGMGRTISLIITLESQIETTKFAIPALIIDDLGEGLDYQKATNLGKYVFDRCKESGIQLITASNDNFLLDVIDLDYWNILRREGSKVTAINKTTHPKVFEDFTFTGLSNFSLLTSDYLDRKLKELNAV